MTPFEIVAFDSARHGAFVLDTFRKSLGNCWPWSLIRAANLLDDLKRILAGPDARAVMAVLPDDHDTFLAWAAARAAVNEVVFAYTAYPYRHKFRIGTSLVLAAGVDLTKPTGVRYWTRAAERIARRPGYRLYARVTDDVEEAA